MNNRTLKSIGLYIISAILIFTFAFAKQGNTLKPKEFAQKIKATPNAQVIDVRTPGEFKTGFIEGAVNIDWNGGDFDTHISTVDKNKPTFVYCRSGKRSADAAEEMREMGFKEVYELSGGIQAWEFSEMPIKKPKK